MKIAVFHEPGTFGSNFFSSFYEGLNSGSLDHEIIGPYKIRENEDLQKYIDTWTENKPDLIVGPNTSALLKSLIENPRTLNIPIVSTQATSTALENRYDNYLQLAVSNGERAELLLSSLSRLYRSHRDIYLFTKEDSVESFSSNMREEFIKRFNSSRDFKRHILFDYKYKVEENNLVIEGGKTLSIVTNLTTNSLLKLNYRYPVVICAEGLPTVHLVKYLIDQGVKNKIFAFGTGEDLRKKIMIDTYLTGDGDDDIGRNLQGEYKRNLMSMEFGKRLSQYEKDKFIIKDFQNFKNQLAVKNGSVRNSLLAVRRLKNDYSTTIVSQRDIRKLVVYLFAQRVLEKEKWLAIAISIITVSLTIISVILAVWSLK